MNVEVTRLASGLTVASERLPGFATATVAVNVAAGSRDEAPEKQGIAHLLEHMAFKGTATRNARALAEAFDEIGGQNNAYTSSENTVYYAKVMAGDVALATTILGDILTESTLDEAELERERDVVLQEIAMHRDMPEDYAGDKFQETAFHDQPLGRSILGTEEHIASFTSHDLRDWMAEGYTPADLIVSAAGAVDHGELVRSAAEAFAGLPDRHPKAPREMAKYTGGDWREAHDLEQVHLYLGLPSMPLYDADYRALQLFTMILGGGISSRLFQEVRELRGLAYHVQSFASSYTDCGNIAVYTATSEDKLAELIPVIAGQFESLTQAVGEAELGRARKQHLASLAMARESTTAVAEWIARHLMLYGEVRSFETLSAQIDAVTAEDVARVGRRLLSGPLTVAAYGPVGGLDPYAEIAARFAA